MYKFGIVLFSVSIVSAQATPVIVEEVKDRRATVYVPPNVELKPGDSLFLEAPAQTNPIVKDQPAPKPTPAVVCKETPPQAKQLRHHHITASIGTSDVNLAISGPITADLSGKGSSVGLGYGYNFGYFMPAISASSAKTSSGSATDNSDLTVAGVRINIIEDSPGNDLIPYVSIGAGYYDETYNVGPNTAGINGPAYGWAAGLLWYPSGEWFALDLSYSDDTANLSTSGAEKITADLHLKRLMLGWEVVF